MTEARIEYEQQTREREVAKELSIQEAEIAAREASEKLRILQEKAVNSARIASSREVRPESPSGDSLTPGAFSALAMLDSRLGTLDTREGERRAALARWITHPDNPLVRRVIVNRLWQWHFGTGLVDTPSDFGYGGGRPSHPELLDWLAAELAKRNWSLKAMHRLIVMSGTYKQSSSGSRQDFRPHQGKHCRNS